MIKQKIFETMDLMYQTQMITKFTYQIFLLIEFVQMLYYSVQQTYLFNTDYFKYFVEAISYFQPLKYLTIVDQNIFSVFVIFSFIYLTVVTTLLIYILLSEKSMLVIYATRTYNVMMVGQITIFIMPFISIFLATYRCEGTLQCDSIFYYILIILSSLGLLMLIITIIYFEIFLIDYNPFTPIAYASKYTKLNWIELIFKIYLPFFAVMDSKQNAEKPFIIILMIMYFGMITMRLKTRQFIENSINISKLCQTSLLFWSSFVSVCHAFLDQGVVDDMGFFYEVICSPIVVYCCFKLNKNPELMTHIKKDIQLEETVQEMIHLIENKDKSLNRMKLEGFVKLHQKDCLKSVEQCPCSLIHQDTLRCEDNEKINDKQSFDRTTRWYSFLQALIQNSSDRLQTTRIQIIRAYILQKKLKNKFKAFYELAIAQKQRVQFQDEFCIYRVQNQIELEMIEQDKNQEIDVQQIVNFQNFYIQFETSIEKSVNLHLEYWRELQEESPDIGKLQQLGSSITGSIDETEQLYEKLIKINSIHLKTLEIYGNFLTHVVNNDIEGNRIIDKSDQISKNLEINRIIDSEKFKYDQNSDTCIITCSVNIDNLGTVTNCNNEIQKLLGYKKADLLRQNVSRIMPRILASVHDDFIRSFIQTSQSKVLGIERQVFALNKNGFLVPCSLMIRVLPNLKSGLQIVGFLKKSDNTDQYFYLMFDELSHSILGFSESVNDKFGIPVGVSNGQLDLPVGEIAPELIDTCKKQGSFNFTIDTTVLLSNYQIIQDESLDDVQQQEDQSAFYGISRDPYEQNLLDRSQINEKTVQNDKSNIYDKNGIINEKQSNHKTSKFKSALVKGVLVEDSEYANAKIKIIQFIEESEEVIINKEVEEKKVEEQPDFIENVIQSEVSAGSGISVNEEIRQIKDFKLQMGEKSEASKIIFLNRIILLLSIILIILSSIQLGYRLQQNEELLNGQLAIFTAYYRTSVMADVIFYTRYLQLMAKGNVTYDSTFRDKLSLQVNSLKSIQYQLIKYQIDMESKKNMFTDNSIEVSYLYENSEQSYTSTLSDAIFQLVTSASIIRNASLSSFIDSNSTENTLKNVYFIIRNGYQLLREGSQNYAQIYYDFFIYIIGDYDTIFYIVLSFAIASLVIAQFFLIPIVIRVHNINNQVMSLFGLLSQKDIKELATRSEQFKITYLSNMSNTIKEQQQIKTEQDKQALKQLKQKELNQNDQSNVIMEINNENIPQSIDPQITSNQPLNSAMPTHKNITEKPLKQQQQQQQQQDHEEQQIQDQEALRQQKLLNSKSSTSFSVALKFIIMMLLFMTYFIVNVILEQQLVDQSSIIYNHLKYSTIRSYDLKFSIYFTVEYILQETNYKDQYLSDLYENERLCLESLQQDFSSTFNSYIDIYNQFNLQSLCLQVFSTDQFILDVNQCSILSGGILDRGLRNSITSLALWASNTITTDIKILDTQSIKNYIEQVYYLDQAIVYLNSQYELAMGDFVDSQQQIEKIKFAIFIIGLVFIFLFIWTPYNKEMSSQIWRTKGMLNMIPFEMIKAQESLKNAFLKGNIIANVK